MGKHKKKDKKKREKRKEKSDSSDEDLWVEKPNQDESKSSKKRSYNSSSSDDNHEKRRRKYSSSSDDAIPVEKKKKNKKKHKKKSKKRYTSSSDSESSEKQNTIDEKSEVIASNKREDWLDLKQTNFMTFSNDERKREREERKNKEKEASVYNPSKSSRELNPYWRDGGDGMPNFQKPKEDFDSSTRQNDSWKNKSRGNWRKNKNESTKDSHGYVYENISEKTREDRHGYSYENRSEKDKTRDHKTDKVETKTTLNKTETNYKTTDDKQQQNEETGEEILTEKQLNALAAKLVKAEIMGNLDLVEKLKTKLENARKQTKAGNTTKQEEEEVLLTQTDAKTGFSKPFKLQEEASSSNYNKKKGKKRMETHEKGERLRYFADDDKYSLKDMFEQEKSKGNYDQNEQFAQLAGKLSKNDDLDDLFSDNIRKEESCDKINKRNIDRAINEHKTLSKSLENCYKCLQNNMNKHLVISTGENIYLSLPDYEPMDKFHCLISSIRHCNNAVNLDENEWEELMDFRRGLVKMFASLNQDVIFFETSIYLNKHPHFQWHCVPMDKEVGDMAPIYFKKAIDESEFEWSHNKKLVSLKGKNVRKCVPKGLPYFCVSFGMEEGFAHVIEEEQLFPVNFAQEIIGGMLDLHHDKWRRPKKQHFEQQKSRVLEFTKLWKDFDITKD